VGFHAYAQPAHHGGGDPIGIIQALHDQLGLNTSQQQQWDAAGAASQAAPQAMRAGMQQLKAGTQAEPAQAERGPASHAPHAGGLRQQNAPTRKAARDAWLALYATLNTQQKGVVRDAITAKMAKMEQMRERMRERLSQ